MKRNGILFYNYEGQQMTKKKVETAPKEIKLDKNFKLSKQTKAMMANILDADTRNHFKNLMIEAELICKHTERWIMK